MKSVEQLASCKTLAVAYFKHFQQKMTPLMDQPIDDDENVQYQKVKDYKLAVLIFVSGPIVIATGFLLLTCGVVWHPVAITRKKISIRRMKVEYRQLGVIDSF